MQVEHAIEDFSRAPGNYIFRLNVKKKKKRKKIYYILFNLVEMNLFLLFFLQYRDPEPNFDRRNVKGKLFNLFEVKDDRFLKALDLGAGGKLQEIVVQDENVSRILLKKNCFDFNVKMIPNNKILHKTVAENINHESQKIA